MACIHKDTQINPKGVHLVKIYVWELLKKTLILFKARKEIMLNIHSPVIQSLSL